MIQNPKLIDSNLIDCKPQVGPCPVGCSECYYNRPGAFYADIQEPLMPTAKDAEGKIVRVNSGYDSNLGRDEVIRATSIYPDRFFNTSIPKFDFPGPVVFTANPKEEEMAVLPHMLPGGRVPLNLMFVRLRVSGTNLHHIDLAVHNWTTHGVPTVLTFMRFFTKKPAVEPELGLGGRDDCYEWKKSTLNEYWCAKPHFIKFVRDRYQQHRLVSICGSFQGSLCKNCRNCEMYYIQTAKRLRGE